jgi:hypothetical protein
MRLNFYARVLLLWLTISGIYLGMHMYQIFIWGTFNVSDICMEVTRSWRLFTISNIVMELAQDVISAAPVIAYYMMYRNTFWVTVPVLD